METDPGENITRRNLYGKHYLCYSSIILFLTFDFWRLRMKVDPAPRVPVAPQEVAALKERRVSPALLDSRASADRRESPAFLDSQ